MNRLLYVFLFFVAFQTQLTAQASINDYKYIIVPKQFEFLKSQDQYETSSLTKFLFNKYGYTAFFDNEDLPKDLSTNRCLALISDIKKIKGFLITRLQIDLVDCNGNVVMSSQIGETKIKEYERAYQTAIREAFETYRHLDYKYEPSEAVIAASKSSTTSEAEEIEELKKEVEALKAKKEEMETISEEKKSEKPILEKKPKKVTKQIIEDVVELEPKSTPKTEILYAQPKPNGYQVVDMTPKVVMFLLNTSKEDIYLVKDENAIVYKEDGFWFLSKFSNDNLSLTQINLKF
ncbi:hypothetical protein [Psychroserpens sp. Hel_I_66]|uniref:hypothetical protein n=1 Tax=Psychroserpens sp. Hel_I_66 TaxID=1250004 RepID=UPI000646DCD1|nr:hypothetical protein [Psychroserpens sp. Hel_I_66]